MNTSNGNNNLVHEMETKNEENMNNEQLFTKGPKDKAVKNENLSATVKALVGGKEQEIIPAFTNYSMEQPKKKEDLLNMVDKDKMLDVIFHFADPKVFWKEGHDLFDRNGQHIKKDTPNVYVFCDTADTYWRVFMDQTLEHVEFHTFNTVEEYAQTIGNSTLLSRGLNNVEKVGIAALATGNEAYKAVFEFAKKNNLNISTAQHYFDLKFKPSTTSIMLLGHKPKVEPTIERTAETAQELYEQMCLTFNNGGAKKRYAIQVVNQLLNDKKYSYEEVMEGLRTIPANEIAMADMASCGNKSICIMETLSSWLIDLRRNRPAA